MALRELTVENLAVVESVRLALSPGLTVLTGETGAGKSLVVDAVALVLGARASADQVRTGATSARIEAVLEPPHLDDDDPMADVVRSEPDALIVRREVGADGRSGARVNDRAVTIGGLATLGERLGEIHGQHEQQRLLDPARQLALLDRHGDHEALLARVGEAHRAWRATRAAADELLTDAHELARRLELLRHQVDEIEMAGLQPGEDAEVESALRVAQHAETIARAAAEAVAALREERAAVDALGAAERALLTAAQHDDRFAALADRASGLGAEAAELARDVAQAAERVELDPASKAALEERLALLYDLRRKYGDTLEAVIAFGEDARTELDRLENQEGERERLRAQEAERLATLEEAAALLTAARRASGDRLAEAVNAELPALGLPAGSFGVAIEAADLAPTGADGVTFTFAPNPGESPRPLGRIASGGEASRLSLALKVILATADETPLLVFDEVDAGIGGRNASALGERLHRLSRHHQVLCVTHLPQVAAHADAHLVVRKAVVKGRTLTEVHELGPTERTRELAAMLAGEGAGDEAQLAAEALLRSAGAGR